MGAWMRDKEKRTERNLERNKPQRLRPRDPGLSRLSIPPLPFTDRALFY